MWQIKIRIEIPGTDTRKLNFQNSLKLKEIKYTEIIFNNRIKNAQKCSFV
jgi:hypothetical protein